MHPTITICAEMKPQTDTFCENIYFKTLQPITTLCFVIGQAQYVNPRVLNPVIMKLSWESVGAVVTICEANLTESRYCAYGTVVKTKPASYANNSSCLTASLT